MNEILTAGILGGLGGLTRGTLGLLKAMSIKKRINWTYWGLTIIIAVIIGLFTGAALSSNLKVSLLTGYAGTDILEGILKSFKTRKAYSLGKYKNRNFKEQKTFVRTRK